MLRTLIINIKKELKMKIASYKATIAIALVLAFSFTAESQIDMKILDNKVKKSTAQQVAISKKIVAPYLKGLIGITCSQTSSFNPNSSLNTFRAALGMNMQGTETVRISMYGNRYPFEKVFILFGAIQNYGAQNIK